MQENNNAKIYTVTEFNRLARNVIEEAFPVVWVEGEIANYLRHTSGHIYFSLRDENSQIRAAMFRGRNRSLRFEPENGLRVEARGRPSIYERGGQYQIIVDHLQPSGIGPLELAFQQIRQRLEAEGLFNDEHKQPIPVFPLRVGVVTSPTGAAFRDVVRVLGRRSPWIETVLRPTQVQGEGAAEDIANAVTEFNEYGDIDVLIVGRGGGSMEDLWAFNDEIVARAIFASEIPIVSAVGHEIDHTISDLVADRRAATPSAAAELVAPDRHALERDLKLLGGRVRAAMTGCLRVASLGFRAVAGRWASLRLEAGISQQIQWTDEMAGRLMRAMTHGLELKGQGIGSLASRLNSVSPLAVLARGYSICTKDPDGEAITDATTLAPEDRLLLRFSRGEATCLVEEARAPGKE